MARVAMINNVVKATCVVAVDVHVHHRTMVVVDNHPAPTLLVLFADRMMIVVDPISFATLMESIADMDDYDLYIPTRGPTKRSTCYSTNKVFVCIEESGQVKQMPVIIHIISLSTGDCLGIIPIKLTTVAKLTM